MWICLICKIGSHPWAINTLHAVLLYLRRHGGL